MGFRSTSGTSGLIRRLYLGLYNRTLGFPCIAPYGGPSPGDLSMGVKGMKETDAEDLERAFLARGHVFPWVRLSGFIGRDIGTLHNTAVHLAL